MNLAEAKKAFGKIPDLCKTGRKNTLQWHDVAAKDAGFTRVGVFYTNHTYYLNVYARPDGLIMTMISDHYNKGLDECYDGGTLHFELGLKSSRSLLIMDRLSGAIMDGGIYVGNIKGVKGIEETIAILESHGEFLSPFRHFSDDRKRSIFATLDDHSRVDEIVTCRIAMMPRWVTEMISLKTIDQKFEARNRVL